MACQEYDSLLGWLRHFEGTDPVGAAICPYVNSAGGGIPIAVVSLLVFGPVGLALTIRTQHPGPIVVAVMLSASTVAATVPGIAAKMLALVILFVLVGSAIYLYQRAQTTL